MFEREFCPIGGPENIIRQVSKIGVGNLAYACRGNIQDIIERPCRCAHAHHELLTVGRKTMERQGFKSIRGAIQEAWSTTGERHGQELLAKRPYRLARNEEDLVC